MLGIGILYPGDLGSVLGKSIPKAGGIPITCLMGRSEATRKRAEEANFTVASSLEELGQQADVLVSLVPPRFAIETARDVVANVGHARRARLRVYIDANSVSPGTKRKIAEIVSQAELSCLDGAFFGPAGQIGPDNLLALSGPGAERIAPFFQRIVEVRVMGHRTGPPSAAKMALGILTKALCALFVEMVCASGKDGGLDGVLDLMWRFYPGTMHFLERSLPTYPMHVARKADELVQIVDWLDELRVRADMTHSAAGVLRHLERAGFERRSDWQFNELVRQIAERDVLHLPQTARSKVCV